MKTEFDNITAFSLEFVLVSHPILSQIILRSSSVASEDEVIHQLVTLLCEFMSNPRNDNEFGRTQEYVISQIKHHVGLQMGYNVTAIGEFTGSPGRLRYSLFKVCTLLFSRMQTVLWN